MPLKQSLHRFFKRGECDSATKVKPCAEAVELTDPSRKPLAPQGAHGSSHDQPQQNHINSSMTVLRPSVSDVNLSNHIKPNGKSLFRSLSVSVTRARNKAAGAFVPKRVNNTQLGSSSLATKAPQNTTQLPKTNTACSTSAKQGLPGLSSSTASQRLSSPSRVPLQATPIQISEQSCRGQEHSPRADSLAYARPEMAHPHRNGKKLFEGLHSDLEPILKTTKSGERRKSAIRRRSLHGTKRVTFASEPVSKKSQLSDPSLAHPGLQTSTRRTLMPNRYERRLSFSPGRRRSTLMTVVASPTASSASDEASVETDTFEPEDANVDRQVSTQCSVDPEHHLPSRPCYADFVRHNTMKLSRPPPAGLPAPLYPRRTTARRRSLLVSVLHCKILVNQPFYTQRRQQRLQDIPSEALS